ncbi:MAG TPA: polymer-forming cytoskeletal protein [Ardenticatenaceae bacterium]|jgi:hypothetical protein
MMRQHRRFAGVVLLLLLFALFASGCSNHDEGDGAVFGGSRIIESGETLEGDLVVFGGNAIVEEGATVNGDIAVFGGNVEINGEVTGDLAAFGGNIDVDGRIEGGIASFGGNVDRTDGVVEGDVEVAEPPIPPLPPEAVRPVPELPEAPDAPRLDDDFGDFQIVRPTVANRVGSLVASIVQTFFTMIALGALGLVLTLFLPEHVRRVSRAAETAPAASTAVGCLAFPVVGLAAIVAAITIIGIPLAILMPFLLAAAGVLGWIGLGMFFGDRLLRSADVRSPRPAAAAAIGSGGLVLVTSVVGIVPFFGWLLSPLLGMWGLGAAILTRGGTKNYPVRPLANQPVPPLTFDPLENIPPTPAPSKPRAANNDLFADLAADLGLSEEDLRDDEDDTRPSRGRGSDEETPLPPPQ